MGAHSPAANVGMVLFTMSVPLAVLVKILGGTNMQALAVFGAGVLCLLALILSQVLLYLIGRVLLAAYSWITGAEA